MLSKTSSRPARTYAAGGCFPVARVLGAFAAGAFTAGAFGAGFGLGAPAFGAALRLGMAARALFSRLMLSMALGPTCFDRSHVQCMH